MAAVAGIHFGNTNCVVAVCKDGKVQTVSNETGDRVTPTIVGYTGNEKIIGQPAKQFLIRNSLSCISNIKGCIGSFDETAFKLLQKDCSCQILHEKGSVSYQVKVEEDLITVSNKEAMSYIFTRLLEIAESIGGSDLEDVVIAVPHSFTEQQKTVIREAAESIGFNILRVISEPAAAVLEYGISQENPSEDCNVLLFRLGGSSTDACLLKVNSGLIHVVGEIRKTHFGANDFDDVLIKYFAGEFKKKFKEDISNNSRAIGKLRPASEECKKTLSRMESATCSVDSLYDGLDFQNKILRVKFESMCSNLISQCIGVVDELLKTHQMHENDIQKVLLVGGGTHMPKIVQTFKSKFSTSDVISSQSSDEVIARGAALQAGLLNSESEDNTNSTSKIKCVSKNIGIKGKDSFDIIVSKQTPTPTTKTKKFQLQTNQTSVVLPIYEFPDNSFDNAKLLAKLVMKDIPNSDQNNELTLSFLVNRSGNMIVTLSDDTGKTENVTIDIEHLVP